MPELTSETRVDAPSRPVQPAAGPKNPSTAVSPSAQWRRPTIVPASVENAR